MSIQASFEDNKTLIKPEIKQKNLNDYPFNLKKPSLIRHNSLTNSPKKVTHEPLNKNGFNKKELNFESNRFNHSESKTQANNPILNNYKYNNIKKYINQQNSGCYDIINNGFKSKLLEFKLDKASEFDLLSQIQDCQKLSYQNKRDIELYYHILEKKPMISREFILKKNAANNIYTPKENIIKDYICKLSRNQTKIHDTKQKFKCINKIDFKTKNNAEKEETKEQYKLNISNIPDNFFIKYNLKKIISKDLQTFNTIENPMSCIYFEDMKDFIYNLCNKIVNKNKSEKTNNKIDDEFIEYLQFDENLPFLQKKRSNEKDFDEIENLYDSENENQIKKKKSKKNKKSHKKISKKDKKENKNNNKKNGVKISLYLNQIQINDSRLENFPFFPLIGIRENIKIEFLKGIIDKKNLIKVNKKAECIKDQRNLKYIYNKQFELYYVNKENDKQYIVYIKEFHILHLILYYYYTIQEGIKFINKYHYSHSSFEKSQKMTKQIGSLIKKCNKIVDNITY